MLLCPEASHTSPTSTFAIFRSPITSVRGSLLAAIGSRSTRQRPSVPAVPHLVCPANETVTFSPGWAVPHTGTRIPRCSTMLSANGAAGTAAAPATAAATDATAKMIVFEFILFSFLK